MVKVVGIGRLRLHGVHTVTVHTNTTPLSHRVDKFFM